MIGRQSAKTCHSQRPQRPWACETPDVIVYISAAEGDLYIILHIHRLPRYTRLPLPLEATPSLSHLR